ncbi:MAG: aminopeptidase P family protein [Lachnospiraceae bacterium]|nr:aminopeptidase P family protein [Lachnospiraceae bacterium]
MTDNNLKALLNKMQDEGIDFYIVPSSDPHMSEYVCAHFWGIRYITGFTGESATLVVSKSESGLWIDGRYFIQAKNEIKGSGAHTFEMGEEGVPTVLEYLKDKLKKGDTLGYDGKLISYSEHKEYEAIAERNEAGLCPMADLLSDIWEEREALPCSKVWILSDDYSGESVSNKISRLRKALEKENCNGIIISELTDIAWLLNLRGDDIENTPVFMSYFVLANDDAFLYANVSSFDDDCKKHLDKAGVKLKEYEDVYEDVKKGFGISTVLIDEGSVNAALVTSLPNGCKTVIKNNPTSLFKAKKNDIEIANTRKAHVEDGLAVTKFIYSIKSRIGKEDITELSAMKELHKLRTASPEFLDESFETISAYGPNAAMMHYTATEESYSELKPKGFLLVDSGGHYKTGTTDITRTIALGSLTEEEKRDYTMVLRAHLRLLSARFPEGVSGYNLDVLSRGVLWDEALDYRCGTGHGVGHILSVHEGPNAFRWKAKKQDDIVPLSYGMITTDEPGIYIEGKYGIRIESELLCVPYKKTEYGQFYEFENLTFAPMERDAIVADMLTTYEKDALNSYHKAVYEKLAPLLSDDEREWLFEVTKEI